jgi:hypothetical protein
VGFLLGSILIATHDASPDGCKAKKAKSIIEKRPAPSNNSELQRVHDARSPPPWFPKRQRIWDHAMLQVSNVDLEGGQSSRRFALPPVHLFWGASEQNQRTYYYHLLVLRREFSLRAQGDRPGLFTEEWRSILGNTYWKSMWPRPKPDDVNSSNFDAARFWIYGGPLFFGDELSAKVTCGHDPTSFLPCHCGVELDMADDVKV